MDAPVRRCEWLARDGFKRGRGRPKKYWREVIRHDMEKLQLTEDMPLDRKLWRRQIRVILSRDGKIVEFQPTSRVAENQRTANPLVKELYKKKKLVPGLIEQDLMMITRPSDVVLELLMSSNPQSPFAL
ncbi:hypothetical protein P3L10_014054 [Capsicum annuum]